MTKQNFRLLAFLWLFQTTWQVCKYTPMKEKKKHDVHVDPYLIRRKAPWSFRTSLLNRLAATLWFFQARSHKENSKAVEMAQL